MDWVAWWYSDPASGVAREMLIFLFRFLEDGHSQYAID